MDTISLNKLKELYLDTIQRCSSNEMIKSEEIIEYNVFEEFDIGFVSFLNLNNIEKLFEEKLISLDMLNKTRELIEQINYIKTNSLWNINAVKENDEWKIAIKLCDDILELNNLYCKDVC